MTTCISDGFPPSDSAYGLSRICNRNLQSEIKYFIKRRSIA